MSYLFLATFNMDYNMALALMGALTAVYLVLGGYKSMTMIDVAFGMIMTVGVLILLYATLGKAGGLANHYVLSELGRSPINLMGGFARMVAAVLPRFPDQCGAVCHAATGSEILRHQG